MLRSILHFSDLIFYHVFETHVQTYSEPFLLFFFFFFFTLDTVTFSYGSSDRSYWYILGKNKKDDISKVVSCRKNTTKIRIMHHWAQRLYLGNFSVGIFFEMHYKMTGSSAPLDQ